ncbi:hypothetical protein JR316_0004556 [Psilocybe cubensis]|uniref:Uncharacterized protein n=2 Tax=Psilocybe cubensis TaxID=181762 RepID=A0ACB8H4N1_PSICU|nr:hypothetical protein JR316_0004556 [Psilocybe cubensis]KAH9482456.1 hypothetical protein JR316_0004556 [Psilocybe cubensis]
MSLNDPAALLALLEQLKASAAWHHASGSSQAQSDPAPIPSSSSSYLPDSPSARSSLPSASVASLLSQLNSPPVDQPPPAFAQGYLVPQPQETLQDRSKFSFRQSLPVVSELSDNPSFSVAVKRIKSEQDDLERRLWADREAIYAKYHEKLKNAQTKARMIGGTVSQHELNMITDAFKKEIQKFDIERVLPAWDGLISRQQLELSQMGVPTMFVTANVDDRQRQQQVVGLLETLLGPKAAV